VYDRETELYYLQSRYYNPEWGRFISADSQFDENAGLVGNNLFAYCANNPVCYKDNTGMGIVLACVIAFGIIGAAIGGYIAGSQSKSQLGYVNGWWVVGGALAGGGAGCLLGWGVGAAASAIGASLTVGSGGTLGATIYANWQSAEQALRNLMNSVSSQVARTFQTPWGNRIVDAYNSTKRIIAEAKYGYQGLSEFIKTEIARDAWLLETGRVKAVEWHFYVSQVTGKGGPSGPLLEALLEAGITVIFH
jgi:RHS repeat-associated protein